MGLALTPIPLNSKYLGLNFLLYFRKYILFCASIYKNKYINLECIYTIIVYMLYECSEMNKFPASKCYI